MALTAIQMIRAVRAFSDRPVPDDVIRQIVDAGRRSQSSKNSQPWQFVVVRHRDTLARLAQCGTYAGHVAAAAFAVALVAPPGTAFDQGQATAYMMLAAWDLEVGACIATMHDSEQAQAVLGVPTDLDCQWTISFGYPAQAQPTTLKRGGRRSFEEVVHWEHW